jgi:CheY-like chemotaxis protein
MGKIMTFCTLLALNTSLLVADANIAAEADNELLIATLVLGAIGILALVVSSWRLSKVKKEYKKIETSSKELEEKQSELLSDMSENIHKMVKQAIGSTSAIASKIQKGELNQELNDVLQTENQLLDVANDLIEFLHLKAKKVKISNQNYKIDNLLNDITGFISKNFQTKSIQLTYKIEKSIPDELIGDTLKISKVLYNLLDYSLRNGANDLQLKLYKAPGFQSKTELIFSIYTNLRIDVESDAFFFKTQYDEINNSYDALGLFVAKELATLMQGELIARNDKNGCVEFLLSMNYQYPSGKVTKAIDKRLLAKKVLIVEGNPRYGDSVKEMLSAYEYKTTLYTIEDFFLKINALEPYDLIFLDEKLFNATVIKALEKLSKKSDLKIIALNNFFNPIDAHYYTKAADYKLLKPTTRGTVKRLLEKIYLPQEEQEALAQQESRTTNLKIYKHDFAKTPDVSIDTFALFKGLKLLIVEDDIINQKVLLGVLKRSGMEIDIANNGEECLEILKEKKHYDLILMDINMPKMDGYSATREIRKNSEYDSIPIISLTALISADEISKMFDVGMNAHLAKPLHKEKLFTAFDMFLTQTNDSVELPKQIKEPKTSFEGLNIQKGIQQANNNEEFYREILAEFLATYQDSAQLFEKLITDFRYEQVRMLCLDIKGLSGIIGATELHTLMYDIHHQLVFKKFDMLHGYVKPFYEKVELVNESIKEYLES